MNKRLIATMLGIAIATGVIAVGANAHFGANGEKSQFYNDERHAKMTEIFGNKDYNAWKALVEEKEKEREARVRPMDVITEENFSQFVDMKQLYKDGKFEEAEKIREELGLPDFGKKHGKFGKWHKNQN